MCSSDLLDIIATAPPDIVLLDVMMPDMDGFELARRIKSVPGTAHIPVVMVTALSEPSERVRGLEAGADDFLTKPLNDLQLFARVRSLVRLKQTMDEFRLREETSTQLGVLDPDVVLNESGGNARILAVNDQPAESEAIVAALRDFGEVTIETDPAHAQEIAGTGQYDLIIVSLRLKNADGLRLCSHLRSSVPSRNAVLLALVEAADTQQLVRALEMGVADYVVKPVERNELIARVRTQLRRKRYQDRLRQSYQMSVAMAVKIGRAHV